MILVACRKCDANLRNQQSTVDSFTQYMRIGYAATQQRDYQTALINFRRALNERPENPYALRAIANIQTYLQRSP